MVVGGEVEKKPYDNNASRRDFLRVWKIIRRMIDRGAYL